MKCLMTVAAALFLLAACDMEQMQSDKLDTMELTEKQREVADALVEGYKKEMGNVPLRSRDIMRAGCYAKSVRIPSNYHAVHVKYLRNYTEIDENYYPWFQRQGFSDNTAYKIGEWVSEGFEECSVGALLKRRFSKD